ncbi:uncharacterized protein RJT20DRAFT_22745 [Scheffersomyces xylosifermentans]|uniref:uncharacterized protein n=1 Tax=Scheffersomyces xylosifermentans TaxID=1304137 RepID=UPI00315CA8AB
MSSDENPELRTPETKTETNSNNITNTGINSSKSGLDGDSTQRKRESDASDRSIPSGEGEGDDSDSPKNYKNLSINSILNIHGKVQNINPGQGGIPFNSANPRLPSIGSAVAGVPKDLNQQDPKYHPYSRNQYFSQPPHHQRGVSSIDSKLSATSFADSNTVGHLQQQQQQQQASSGYPDGSVYPTSSTSSTNDSHAIGMQSSSSGTSTSSQLQSQYGHASVPLGYSHLVQHGGNHPMYPPSQGSANVVSQQIIPTGAPLHQMQFHPLQHQTHSASDLDPLHESKRGRRFRRRYNQIVRKYSCSYPGCVKSYGSLNHLNTHIVTKKHGHRKSKADFQYNQISNEDVSSHQAQQAQYSDGTSSHYQSQIPQYAHSEYTSGNYWYGYPPQIRGNQQVTAQQQQVEHSVHPSSAPPPPGSVPPTTYMYYSPGYPQPVPPPLSQQRPPMNWPQQSYQPYSHLQGQTQLTYQQIPASSGSLGIQQQQDAETAEQQKTAPDGTSPPVKR